MLTFYSYHKQKIIKKQRLKFFKCEQLLKIYVYKIISIHHKNFYFCVIYICESSIMVLFAKLYRLGRRSCVLGLIDL